MTDAPAARDAATARRAYVAWGLALAATGLALAAWGVARGNFRADVAPAVPGDVALPRPLEPEGELDAPPGEMKWVPGGDDVDLVQVHLFRSDFRIVWSSPPLRGGADRVDVPPDAFLGVGATEPCFWRVREASGGRPRAASRLVQFHFLTDVEGYGPGENPALSDILRD